MPIYIPKTKVAIVSVNITFDFSFQYNILCLRRLGNSVFVMATIKFHTRKNLRSVVIFVAFTNVESQFVYLSTRLRGVHQIQNSLASLISSV